MVIGYRDVVQGREIVKVFSDVSFVELMDWASAAGILRSWLHRDHFDLWGSVGSRVLRMKSLPILATSEGRHRHAAFRREWRADARGV